MTEVAPFYADLADGPPGGRAVWLRTRDGVRIRVAVWAGGGKGTVLLLPGRTEYVEKYGRAAADLLARGWNTVTVDWRGQGLADRALADPMVGHVGHFDEYQCDLDAVLAWVAAEGLPGPRVMLAHSMGGCIGLRALHRGLGFRAAAFSAPMWGISIAVWMRPLAQVVSSLAGPFGQAHRYAPGTGAKTYVAEAPFQGNVLTTDPEMWDYMRAQVLAHPEMSLGGPSLGWLRAALNECAALMRMPAPDVPAIAALGTQEKVVDTAPVHLRMASWAKGALDLYPGAEHEVLMETPAARKRFFDRACALFDAQRG
ncbi:alpha/beta hydrolase [Rhodobacter sp. Har01]|uniref:alpha/beta hydrolase n=1 Tax=Rhodobacter sp. Har01 TaxID=2883999 RepID=UPI001D060507|nr:alpha/beta hydrolase [Rhodobacter sp. Har01]MCB6178724.1 alpha/beta hydrolase [Rhodobacter sp. Har01]